MGWAPQPRWDKSRKRYYVNVRGKRHILGADYKRAWEKFARVLAEHGPAVGGAKPLTVPRLVQAWQVEHPGEWHTYCLKAWMAQEAITPLAGLPVDTLERLAISLQRKGNSPQTIKHQVNHATRVCRWAVERRHLATMPRIPKTPRVARHPRDIPMTQLRDVLAKLEDPRRARVRALALFILATGCRPKEGRLLQWAEVDLEARICRLAPSRSKTGKPRTIYLTDAAMELLAEARERDGGKGYVFRSRTGKPYTRSGLAVSLRRLGISQYQLRHTFAQTALGQTSMEDVAALLGHSNLATVQVYAQVRHQRARRVADNLVPAAHLATHAEEPGDSADAQPDEPPASRKPTRRKRGIARAG